MDAREILEKIFVAIGATLAAAAVFYSLYETVMWIIGMFTG